MKYLWIFPYYLGWHYGKGTLETVVVFKNFFLFVPKFFSMGTLLKTLFSPFQRLKEQYPGGVEPSRIMSVIIVNFLMRLVGLFVRGFVLILGSLSVIFTLVIEIILFVIWLALPILLAFLFVSGVIAVFNL